MASGMSDNDLIDEYYKRLKAKRATKPQTSCLTTLVNWVLAILIVLVLGWLLRVAGAP